jgi:hypothetical protein
MRKSSATGKPRGKSSAPSSIATDHQARASLGMTPNCWPPQFSKTTGSGQGVNRINPVKPRTKGTRND